MASIITPLTGLVSTGDAVGMAVVMTGAVWLGALVLVVLVRPWRLVAEQDEPSDALAATSS
jgi:DHA1 family bicyclomycin/chloramphenicol resistance-like MFS transporter